MADVVTVASLDNSTGLVPGGSLVEDAAGDLFGLTSSGGARGSGTIYEIVKTPTGYATAPTVLVSFGSDQARPSGLTIDAAGDLFGTTYYGGPSLGGPLAAGLGTVFEIALTPTGYASAPTVLATFSDSNGAYPLGNLVIDAGGNLIGTTQAGGTGAVSDRFGPGGSGTVFEVVRTASGYDSTPKLLVSFTTGTGTNPIGGLISDQAGNLFGATANGGAGNEGTVFELPATASGYASAPIVLASFSGTNEQRPSPLAIDAAGNLFDVTSNGSVLEIARTPSGYDSTPVVLATFQGSTAATPVGPLAIDAAGNLFGTAGTNTLNDSTIFEVAHTPDGYASTPTVLSEFLGTYTGPLVADGAGNLFTTAVEGAGLNPGAVLQVTGTEFAAPCYCCGTLILTDAGERPIEDLTEGDRVITASGAVATIRWVGRRSYAGRFVRGRRDLLPVCIRAGALGAGLPRRDLLVSPLHAMLLDGVLVPAGCLLNDATIIRAPATDAIHYVHIELDRHDLILAEGAPSETYVDDDSLGLFGNAVHRVCRQANPAPPVFCAPRVESGPELDAIRRRLAARAAHAA